MSEKVTLADIAQKLSSSTNSLPAWLTFQGTLAVVNELILAQTIIDKYGYHRRDGDIVDGDGFRQSKRAIRSTVTKELRSCDHDAIRAHINSARRGIDQLIDTMLPEDEEQYTIISGENVEDQPIDCLYYPYLPIRTTTIIKGQTGSGKSQFYCMIAAHVSSGTKLFDQQLEQGVVLIMSEESSAWNKQRILDSGGKVENLKFTDHKKPINLESPNFKKLLYAVKPKLIIIDPIQKFMCDRDMNVAQDVRAVMGTLNAYCHELNAACIIVCHESKSSKKNYSRTNSTLGSVDFESSARSVLMVVHDPEEEQSEDITAPTMHIMIHDKSNATMRGRSIKYVVKSSDPSDLQRLAHAEPVQMVKYTLSDYNRAVRHRQTAFENGEDVSVNYREDIYTKAILAIVNDNPGKEIFVTYEDFKSVCTILDGTFSRTGKIQSYIDKYIKSPLFKSEGIRILTAKKTTTTFRVGNHIFEKGRQNWGMIISKINLQSGKIPLI